ncbi:MAG: LysR family transcriptional regulator, glycine cleavage system transcriptional activator [Acetobacteraceae bacterium]|jgi:LysR family glycine cleavage system transcriptional activator|nr:transcriptional regulator [Rhodopila sp.]MEA2767897.1 LysR family transcriptional regulator, glycine cleavage system transcriptional activator [Acetobacteraceae bacterium]
MLLPSLNGLRAFEAAARLTSFTLAAAELNVTQTAISHQIRRLEEQLGIKLFIRQNRALALTRQAQDYLPSVRTAFEDLRRATARLHRAEQEERLTVSTTASLATKWLVSRVAAFQDANPGMEVRITTSTHLVDFHREEVDIAVRYGRGVWPGLRAHWLMAERLFPVCSPALLNGANPLRQPADLAHHTLLHTSLPRDEWNLWLTAAGLPHAIAARRGLSFDLGFMAIQAAVEGLGIALGRSHLVEADIAAGRLVAPFDTELPRDAGYYVVTPEASADAPKIALFRDWLIASATPTALAAPLG